MTLAVKRVLLAFGLGVAVMLAVAAAYWGLEALLAGSSDHDRGLWEGTATAVIFLGGNAIADRVFRRSVAAKKEDLS